MSTDSTRGQSPGPEARLVSPSWEFHEALLTHRELEEPLYVPRGVESIEVSRVVEVLLKGRLDPGTAEWQDSFLPTLRVGGKESSRMTKDYDGLHFTYYPEIDGNIEGGPVEFRARLGDEFETTGLET